MVVVFTNDFTIDPFQIIIFLSMSCANQGLITGWLGLLWLLANVLGLVC
jgi:hypothetical protein